MRKRVAVYNLLALVVGLGALVKPVLTRTDQQFLLALHVVLSACQITEQMVFPSFVVEVLPSRDPGEVLAGLLVEDPRGQDLELPLGGRVLGPVFGRAHRARRDVLIVLYTVEGACEVGALAVLGRLFELLQFLRLGAAVDVEAAVELLFDAFLEGPLLVPGLEGGDFRLLPDVFLEVMGLLSAQDVLRRHVPLFEACWVQRVVAVGQDRVLADEGLLRKDFISFEIFLS